MANTDGVLKQSRIESEALSHTREALLALLAWPVEGSMFTRKLSGLRFQAQWFQQQVERLFAIEEHDGYMNMVLEAAPHLSGKIDKLQTEHITIREQLHEATTHLERILPDDLSAFTRLCHDLGSIIKALDAHQRKESTLIQEAFSQDIGGECGS